jgi:zinc D-Ala-D-Ala carboxypeptidase
MEQEMTQLSQHFSMDEMTQSQHAVRACIDNTPVDAVVVDNLQMTAQMLEAVRELLGGHPLLISSGYRCQKLNTLIGSGRTSQHTQGLAVDFTCTSFGTPKQICRYLINQGFVFDQLIWEGTWVHMSHAEPGHINRREVLTAVFEPGMKTRYLKGLA